MARGLGGRREDSSDHLKRYRHGILVRFVRTIRSGRHTDDIDEELQFHLEMDMADGRDRRAARLRLGNVARIREETPAAGVLESLDSAFRDARPGCARSAGRRRWRCRSCFPWRSASAPTRRSSASSTPQSSGPCRPTRAPCASSSGRAMHSPRMPRTSTAFSAVSRQPVSRAHQSLPICIAAWRANRPFLTRSSESPRDAAAAALDVAPAEQVNLQYVSSNFFQGSGTLPVIGGAFRDDEDRVDAQPVVVVSHRFWVRLLAVARSTRGANP